MVPALDDQVIPLSFNKKARIERAFFVCAWRINRGDREAAAKTRKG